MTNDLRNKNTFKKFAKKKKKRQKHCISEDNKCIGGGIKKIKAQCG